MTDEQYEIFPADLIARAIRDNGYKTTAHAIAELIDNSVQAGATSVEVMCVEEPRLVNEREWKTVVTIAVLDNGEGMSAARLRMALQFGNGTHLDDRDGIGRFGMGLPTSSLSQCEQVDVWTWQTGPDNALHSRLSLSEITSGEMRRVPQPEHRSVPVVWRDVSADGVGITGTVVVWNDLDRVNWRGAAATLRNTEFLVGRMYRKMIHEDGLRIRLVAVRESEVAWEMDVRPNDPLYLMAPSCTPEPFEDEPMFRPWGEAHPIVVNLDGESHTISVRCSYGTETAMLPQEGHTDPGKHPYGKHAKKNRGVSIVRARRELDLDPSWTDAFRDRWWGIEVNFPPALDEVFGVTNNKQAATNFSEMSAFFTDDTRLDEWEEMREEWRDAGDPRLHLMEVAHFIDQQRKLMRKKLEQARQGVRSGEKGVRHTKREIEDLASEKIKARQEQYKAEVADETPTKAELKQSIINELMTSGGMTEGTAKQLAESIVTLDRKIVFVRTDDDSNAFFSPKPIPGMHEVRLNLNHPAYEQLIQLLDPTVEDEESRVLRERLEKASDTLKMLLAAWTRYELEARSISRSNIAETRREWGKMARLFLEDDDEL